MVGHIATQPASSDLISKEGPVRARPFAVGLASVCIAVLVAMALIALPVAATRMRAQLVQ